MHPTINRRELTHMSDHLVSADLDGERLDRVVAAIEGVSRSRAGELIDAGAVLVAGSVVTTRSRKVREGDELSVDSMHVSPQMPRHQETIQEVPIRYQDEHLLIIAKPAGLVVHPAPGHRGTTLVESLAHLVPPPAGGDPERPGIVHRLDRDTSGLLLVARSEEAHAALIGMMQRREITRVYEALVDGVIEQDSLTIDAPVGRHTKQRTKMTVVADGRDAVTDVDILDRYRRSTRIRATLRTGRTHQIRVHLTAIDHPVSGDTTYGADIGFARSIQLDRPFLHATHLRLLHPMTQQALVIDEPLPEDLVKSLEIVLAGETPMGEEDEAIPPHRRQDSPHLEID